MRSVFAAWTIVASVVGIALGLLVVTGNILAGATLMILSVGLNALGISLVLAGSNSSQSGIGAGALPEAAVSPVPARAPGRRRPAMNRAAMKQAAMKQAAMREAA